MTTLADIAKQAEVSKGTVSRVLNNKPGVPISQPTIDRIKRVAEELGYRPNPLARALATGKTYAIGLCYHHLTEPMFLRILQATETKAREYGYHLIVTSDVEIFSEGSSSVDGLIYIGSSSAPCVQELACRKPVMFVQPSVENSSTPNMITWSEYEAAYLAVQYLAELGHRTIGALWGHYVDATPCTSRVAGFRAGLEAYGITAVEEFDEQHPDLLHRGYLQMERIMQHERRPTAVFARNDYLALGALKWLHKAKITVPEEMSVIHYGDSLLGRSSYVDLTSVSHPNAEASVLALDQLIAMIDNGVPDFAPVTLPITLCRRDSCAPPP